MHIHGKLQKIFLNMGLEMNKLKITIAIEPTRVVVQW